MQARQQPTGLSLPWEDVDAGVGPGLAAILGLVNSKLKGLWVPTSIQRSLSTQWDDITTTGAHITLTGSPTLTTVGPQRGLSFNGTSQSGVTSVTWNTLIGSTAFDFIWVGTQEGAGGAATTGSSTLFNNPGPVGSDGSQWIDMIVYRTAGGPTDFPQSEIWNNAGAAGVDVEFGSSVSRSTPTLVHVTATAGGNLSIRVNGGTAVTNAIVTIRGSGDHMLIGKNGANFFGCKSSLMLACNAVMSAGETTSVQSAIQAAFGQPTWLL